MANNDLTADRLRELLKYDPETGLFTWLVVRRSAHGATKIGSVAGVIGLRGYRHIGLLGKEYLGHRLAWLYMTGKWPTDHVDHKDRNPSNNKWENLRGATHKQNHENRSLRIDSTTGVTGVYLLPNGKWTAKIKHFRKSHHLGCFLTKEEAAQARVKAEAQFFTHSQACEPPA